MRLEMFFYCSSLCAVMHGFYFNRESIFLGEKILQRTKIYVKAFSNRDDRSNGHRSFYAASFIRCFDLRPAPRLACVLFQLLAFVSTYTSSTFRKSNMIGSTFWIHFTQNRVLPLQLRNLGGKGVWQVIDGILAAANQWRQK